MHYLLSVFHSTKIKNRYDKMACFNENVCMKACNFLVIPKLIVELKLKNKYNSQVYKHFYYECHANYLHWCPNIFSPSLQVLHRAFDTKDHAI